MRIIASMIFSILPFRLSHALSALLVLTALSACAASPPAADSGCAASDASLRSAEAWYYAPERAALTAPSYGALLDRAGFTTPGKPRDTARSLQLKTDLDAATAAIDRLDAAYGAVESCHIHVLRGIRTQQAAGSLSPGAAQAAAGAEHRLLGEAMAGAKVASARAMALSQIYGGEAEKWASAHPEILSAVIVASAAPHPGMGYKVMGAGTIHSQPSMSSGAIAPVRKGQRVSGPGGTSKPGWVTLELNDGSIGYVAADIVRPVPPNPSALRRLSHKAAASKDPIVAAVLSARRILPEKSQALEARLEAGSEAADDLARPPPAIPAQSAGMQPEPAR